MSAHPIHQAIRAAEEPNPSRSSDNASIATEPIEIIWARGSQPATSEIDGLTE
jgi:hypothetical protein